MAESERRRVSQQRKLRLDYGWKEVRVWVPDDDSAHEIQRFAQAKRDAHEERILLKLKEEFSKMNLVHLDRVIEAIAKHGASAYITPSGAVLELLSDLAKEGAFQAMSLAFRLLSVARPGSSNYVREQIPGKIFNRYFSGALFIDGSAAYRWTKERPEWADQLKESIDNPQKFEEVAIAMGKQVLEYSEK